MSSDDANRDILRQRAHAGRAAERAQIEADRCESLGDTVNASEARAEAARLGGIRDELDAKYTGPRP